jgi:pyridoxine 5-phosphate synthase
MATLSVNVDHVATLRQARGGVEPDPVAAAAIAELAGAEGIIVHLREDRRHIQDRDLFLIKRTVKTRLNLEMAATEEMIGIAADTRPWMCTLVPEKRAELTTEGGLSVASNLDAVTSAIQRLHQAGIKVSLFIDADENQIQASRQAGADFVEIHTGHYADSATEEEAVRLYQGIAAAVRSAQGKGLRVNLGHGLNYVNIWRFQGLAGIEDYSIGHAIMARAVLAGLDRAVRDMAGIVKRL